MIVRTPWGREEFLPAFFEPILELMNILNLPNKELKENLENVESKLLNFLFSENHMDIMIQRIFATEILLFDNPTPKPFIQSDVPVMIEEKLKVMIFPFSNNQLLHWKFEATYNNPMETIAIAMKLNGENLINQLAYMASKNSILGQFNQVEICAIEEEVRVIEQWQKS